MGKGCSLGYKCIDAPTKRPTNLDKSAAKPSAAQIFARTLRAHRGIGKIDEPSMPIVRHVISLIDAESLAEPETAGMPEIGGVTRL